MKTFNLTLRILRFLIYCGLLGLTAVSFILYSAHKEPAVSGYYLQLWTLFILADIWFHGIGLKDHADDSKKA